MADEQACQSCGQVLPLESFYRCATVKDGRKARCKVCCAQAQKTRLAIPAVRERRRAYTREWNHSRRGRAYHRAHKETNPYKAQERLRRAHTRNVPKIKAREAVNSALRYGRLMRKPCAVCEEQLVEAHHLFGYAPADRLQVIWLCPAHHRRAEERLRKEREGHATLS